MAAPQRVVQAVQAAIVASAVDGIIVIDARGRIEAFNPAAERLFGYNASDVHGRNVSMLMPSPYHGEHDQYLATYLETGMASIIGTGREVKGQRRDGTVFPLHLSVGEMSIGGERKFTGIVHDLSERVRLEERLRASEARWRSIIDSAVMQGVEGLPVSYRLGDEYILTFSIGPAASGDELLLSPFALSRVKKDEKGHPSIAPLYRTALPVTLNQTLVVGASKEEGSKNALILIILAQETARPGTPGGKSVRK